MSTRSQIWKSDILQLQDSTNALTAAFADFKASQDHLHDSYMATFQFIQNQLQEQKPSTTPTPSTETMKPTRLTLQLFDGSNPFEWVFQPESEPDSVQQVTTKSNSVVITLFKDREQQQLPTHDSDVV